MSRCTFNVERGEGIYLFIFSKFKWECEAEMDKSIKFGAVILTCESFDDESNFILYGSCGVRKK
jgi:hypothetical protein